MLNKIVQAYEQVLTDKEISSQKGYSTNVNSLDEMLTMQHKARQSEE